MKKRESALQEPPERWPYVRVKVPDVTDGRPLVMRMPSLGQLHGLLKPWANAGSAQDYAGMESAGAAILRRAWADPSYELVGETDDEVWDALHEAGWTVAHLSGVVSVIQSRVLGAQPDKGKVEEMARFFAQQAGTASGSSGSDGPTAEEMSSPGTG